MVLYGLRSGILKSPGKEKNRRFQAVLKSALGSRLDGIALYTAAKCDRLSVFSVMAPKSGPCWYCQPSGTAKDTSPTVCTCAEAKARQKDSSCRETKRAKHTVSSPIGNLPSQARSPHSS